MIGFISNLFYILALIKTPEKIRNTTDLTAIENQRLVKRDLTLVNSTDNQTQILQPNSVDFPSQNMSANFTEKYNVTKSSQHHTENNSSVFEGENSSEKSVADKAHWKFILWIVFALISTICLCIFCRTKNETRYHLKGKAVIGWIGVFLQGYRDFICSTGDKVSPVFTVDILILVCFLAAIYSFLMISLALIEEFVKMPSFKSIFCSRSNSDTQDGNCNSNQLNQI